MFIQYLSHNLLFHTGQNRITFNNQNKTVEMYISCGRGHCSIYNNHTVTLGSSFKLFNNSTENNHPPQTWISRRAL